MQAGLVITLKHITNTRLKSLDELNIILYNIRTEIHNTYTHALLLLSLIVC